MFVNIQEHLCVRIFTQGGGFALIQHHKPALRLTYVYLRKVMRVKEPWIVIVASLQTFVVYMRYYYINY